MPGLEKLSNSVYAIAIKLFYSGGGEGHSDDSVGDVSEV